jgi:hypothetical protein
MLAIPEGVRPGLRFIPPAEKPRLFPVAPLISWIYTRLLLHVRHVEAFNAGTLVPLIQKLQEGSIRLIIAFRHPGDEDPGLVGCLMSSILPREARRLGVRFSRPPRCHFLYGRDVPEWGGRYLEWFLPNTGGISVFPGKYDSQSINTLRRYMTEKQHPLALAPEGQVTYHADRVAALEPGTAQLAFWCLEDLIKQGRTQEVMIVPVCTSCHYREEDWGTLEQIVRGMERQCGLASLPQSRHADDRPPGRPDAASRERLCARLTRIARHLVGTAEQFYSRFYGARFTPPGRAAPGGEGDAEALQERITAVCHAALVTAESFFGLEAKGDFLARVFAIRYAGLSLMCREDISDVTRLPPLERTLADRVAAEAWLRLRHMELVDVLGYIRADYLRPDSGIDRFVESALNFRDVINRMEGGNFSGHAYPLGKTARIIVNEPIAVSPHWDAYKANRRKGVAEVTEEIFRSFRAVAERGNTP